MNEFGVEIKPAARTKRLLERWYNTPWKINIDRIRYYTESFKTTEGEPIVIRRAKAFANVAAKAPVNLHPDDLIVGYRDVDIKCTSIHCDWSGPFFKNDIEALKARKYEKFILTPEDEKILLEEIFPYWEGDGRWMNTVSRQLYETTPPELRNIIYADGNDGAYPPNPSNIVSLAFRSETDPGHYLFPYDEYLGKGCEGIKQEALDHLASLSIENFEDLKKVPFLRAVVIAMDAAINYGRRYANEALRQAAIEKDPVRKAELEEIAAVCEQVPAKPACTFHEAVQAYMFYKILSRMESIDHTNGLGLLDRWLYPYYQNDLAAGRITKERAQEILESLFIKLAETTQCYSSGVLDWFAGAHSFQSVCLGGIGKNGQDVTNELSYMALDAFVNTRLFQPSVSVRVSSKTPYEFLMKIAQVVSLGTGMPAIVNDDVAIPGILAWKKGLNDPDITVEDARSYVPNGCIEETLPNHYGSTMHSYTNMGAVLEMALFNGYSRVYDRKMLVKYNRDARKWTTFEEVLDGAKAALEECIEFGIGLLNVQEKVEAEFFPTVWQSAFMKDCIELGKSKEEGGARYNCNTLCNNIGVSDMGDSLAAIKKVVFEDRKCTMTELIDALYKNFEGYEELHAALKAAPKFGNDDDFADEWTAWVHNLYTDLNSEKRNPRGGACTGGNASMSTYLPFGKACWALPSGRKAKEPLNDAIGPVQGCDNKGTTALFNSMSKIDHTKQLNTIWNVRLEGDYFKTEDGLHRFAQLVRTFIDQKCHQMQVNCLDNEILHLAQKKPEKYRDLIVRVVGYSAFFTELTPPVQDIIITRTIHKDD